MPQGKTDMDLAIEKIRDLLEKKKGHLLIDGYKDLNSNKTFAPTPIADKRKRELTGIRIKTGTVIDDMIGGGIGVGESLMLYGEYAAGKTQGVFTIIAQCKNYIIVIDTEGTFNLGRIEQICNAREIDFNSLMERIILFEPKNWIDQMVVARSIPSLEEFKALYGKDAKIDVIICDSVINYFRGIEFTGRETLPLKTGFLREFLGALKDSAVVHDACVVFTDQISEKPAMTAYTSKSDTQGAVGGHSVTHFPTYNLFFRKGAGNIRAIRMMDASNQPLCEKAIVINEKGIDDLPKEAKAAKMYAESAKKYDDKQVQEQQLPKSMKNADEVTETDLIEQQSETGLEATE
jgi:RecA/RadA recombinase